jgi:hypothetical protein
MILQFLETKILNGPEGSGATSINEITINAKSSPQPILKYSVGFPRPKTCISDQY